MRDSYGVKIINTCCVILNARCGIDVREREEKREKFLTAVASHHG